MGVPMPNILFCFWPLYVKWSHGIGLLSALCKEAGIKTELCVLDRPEIFDARLADYHGQYVSFSAVCIDDYEKLIPFMRMAKQMGKTVLLGGVWATFDNPVDESVDFVCRGEGQELTEFILHGDTDLFQYKLLDDFDRLPMPDYELFEGIPYERGFPELQSKRIIPYVSSRGCYGKCTFCCIRFGWTKMRIRRKMEEELRFLKDTYNPEVFFLNDAMLPYHDKGWRESWGEFRHPFVAYIRADLKQDRLDWLIDRGMIGCGFGVESGDEKFRNDVLKKGLTDEQLYRTIEILRKNKVFYVPFFMTDIPGENFLMKTKTARMMKSLGGYPLISPYDSLRGR